MAACGWRPSTSPLHSSFFQIVAMSSKLIVACAPPVAGAAIAHGAPVWIGPPLARAGPAVASEGLPPVAGGPLEESNGAG